ncbi:MAG: zinc-binding dehydrogenase, partial [Solirubrobacterales bacterium]|nr:zinc-binding dehydrogenase [Solirubrobacterales bacterium]
TIADLNPLRLNLARELGVTEASSPDELAIRPERSDVLIECSGAAQALAIGLNAVRRGGSVVIVGMAPEGSIRLPLDHLQRREITVTGSFRYAGCFQEAIELAASGKVALEPLITARYALNDVGSALRATKTDATQVKVVVVPNDY